MAQMRGMTIRQTSKLASVNVSWKQGSILGFGGDVSHIYSCYVYAFDNGANVLLFVQDNMTAPSSLKIDNRLQFGCQNGEMFLVLHDKSRTPYQYRFVENKNALAGWAKYANKQLKDHGNYDLSWIAGDYLRDF